MYIYIHTYEPQQKTEQCFQDGIYDVFHIFCMVCIYMNNKKVGLVWGCGNTTVKVPNITVFRFAVPLPFFDGNWVNLSRILLGTSIFCLWPSLGIYPAKYQNSLLVHLQSYNHILTVIYLCMYVM